MTKLKSKGKGPVFKTDEEAAKDPQFEFQGEYKGEVAISDEKKLSAYKSSLAATVNITRSFIMAVYQETVGKKEIKRKKLMAKQKENITDFQFKKLRGTLARNKLNVPTIDITADGEKLISTLVKANRQSPTLGLQPPEGAIVLFDGTSVDAFEKGTEMSEDKLLMPEAITKQKFKDFTLHAEFRSPYMPESGEQARGNSGIYLRKSVRDPNPGFVWTRMSPTTTAAGSINFMHQRSTCARRL